MLITLTYPLYIALASKEETFGKESADPTSLGGFLNEIEWRAKKWYFNWNGNLAVATECSFCQVPFVDEEYTLCTWPTEEDVKKTGCLDCCIQTFVPDLVIPECLLKREVEGDGEGRALVPPDILERFRDKGEEAR